MQRAIKNVPEGPTQVQFSWFAEVHFCNPIGPNHGGSGANDITFSCPFVTMIKINNRKESLLLVPRMPRVVVTSSENQAMVALSLLSIDPNPPKCSRSKSTPSKSFSFAKFEI